MDPQSISNQILVLRELIILARKKTSSVRYRTSFAAMFLSASSIKSHSMDDEEKRSFFFHLAVLHHDREVFFSW